MHCVVVESIGSIFTVTIVSSGREEICRLCSGVMEGLPVTAREGKKRQLFFPSPLRVKFSPNGFSLDITSEMYGGFGLFSARFKLRCECIALGWVNNNSMTEVIAVSRPGS
jgi:hypothetical protein